MTRPTLVEALIMALGHTNNATINPSRYPGHFFCLHTQTLTAPQGDLRAPAAAKEENGDSEVWCERSLEDCERCLSPRVRQGLLRSPQTLRQGLSLSLSTYANIYISVYETIYSCTYVYGPLCSQRFSLEA